MSLSTQKEEIITFKVDSELAQALSEVSNRSAFIRDAIRLVLGGRCPVCRGTGTLTPAQLSHWQEFSTHHRVETCDQCTEPRLVCDHELHTR